MYERVTVSFASSFASILLCFTSPPPFSLFKNALASTAGRPLYALSEADAAIVAREEMGMAPSHAAAFLVSYATCDRFDFPAPNAGGGGGGGGEEKEGEGEGGNGGSSGGGGGGDPAGVDPSDAAAVAAIAAVQHALVTDFDGGGGGALFDQAREAHAAVREQFPTLAERHPSVLALGRRLQAAKA